ncbi:hypothetical protein HRbin23_01624 [bacterium HR23]|nr:hypothetical protein HRbin23_01624 [bacterium HR23]
MVDVALGLLGAEGVQFLALPQGAQGGNGEHLGLAPFEQAGPVGAGQKPYLAKDVAQFPRCAPIGALPFL